MTLTGRLFEDCHIARVEQDVLLPCASQVAGAADGSAFVVGFDRTPVVFPYEFANDEARRTVDQFADRYPSVIGIGPRPIEDEPLHYNIFARHSVSNVPQKRNRAGRNLDR